MITGTIRPPFRDNPHENAEEIKKIVAQAYDEVNQLLQSKQEYTPETHLKLSI